MEVPVIVPSKTNHRVLHTALLTLLIFSILGMGIGIGYFLPKNESQSVALVDKKESKVTATPKSTTDITIGSKILTFKIAYPGDASSVQNITVKAPSDSELVKGTIENETVYDIRSNAGSKYTLTISSPKEANVIGYEEGADIGSSPFFPYIYRGLTSTVGDGGVPFFWTYTSDMTIKGNCGSGGIASSYKPPCGNTVLVKAGTGKNKYDAFLGANCYTDNDKGLEQCDNIVKSIVVKR